MDTIQVSKADFRLEVSNALAFKKMIEAIKNTNEDVNIHIDEKGLWVKTMDKSHVSMILLEIPPDKMRVFNGEGVFSLDLETLTDKILKYVKKDEELALHMDNIEDKPKLVVTIKNLSNRVFKIPTLTVVSEESPEPKINLNAESELNIMDVIEALRDIEAFSDNIQIEQLVDRIIFSSKTEYTEYEKPIYKDMARIVTRDISKAVYNLSYLKGIIDSLKPLTDKVKLEFSTKMPIKITCDTELGSITHYLAPRFEAE